MKDFIPNKQMASPNLTKPMRITGTGIYDNNPTNKPKIRCLFNYYYDHIKPKPKSDIDEILGLFEDKEAKERKKNEIDKSTNDYYVRYNAQGMNRSRSIANYLTPYSFKTYKPLGNSLQKDNNNILKSIEDIFYNYGKGYTPKGMTSSQKQKYTIEQSSNDNDNNKQGSLLLSSAFNNNSYRSRNNFTSGIININKIKESIDNSTNVDPTTIKHEIFKTTSILPHLPFNRPPSPKKKVISDKFHTMINASSVNEYTFRQYHNEKYNLSIDQREEIIDELSGLSQEGLFCLFDGTNGSEVADYCKNHFSYIFKRYLDFNPKSVHRFIDPRKPLDPKDAKRSKRAIVTSTETLFLKAFNKLDDELKTLNQPHMGACSCIIFITNEIEKIAGISKIKKYIYCCNNGDIHCVLLTKYKTAVDLAVVHTDRDENERNRLMEAVGLSHKMIFGTIPYTRAFGHYNLKQYGMTSTPNITKYLLDMNRDKYIVIGTRGIFKYMTNWDLLYFIQYTTTTEEIVNSIISHAISHGVKDNLSCFVIEL